MLAESLQNCLLLNVFLPFSSGEGVYTLISTWFCHSNVCERSNKSIFQWSHREEWRKKLFVLSLSNGKRKYLPTIFNVYLDADYCYRYGHTHTSDALLGVQSIFCRAEVVLLILFPFFSCCCCCPFMFVNVEGVGGDKKLGPEPSAGGSTRRERRNFLGSELSGPFRDDTNSRKKRISAHFEFFWNILVKNWPSPVASWCLWQAQMIRPSFIWISYTADWIWTSRSVVCTRILHTPLLIWVAVGCLCVSVCLKMFRGGGGKRFDFPPPIYVRDCT